MPEIIRFNINLITEQYRNLHQSINIYQIIQDYNESKDLIELNNSQSLIEIDETIIFEILKNKYISKMNAFCNKLNSSYTRLREIVRLKERFRIYAYNQIRNSLPSIKRSNIDKIKRKLEIIANGIKVIIKKKIKLLIQLMLDQKVLDKIISKENELISLFKDFLVEIVNNRFSMKINNAYESIQEISDFKDVIFLKIEHDLRNEMPQLTKKMKSKKAKQIFVKVLIGIGAVLAAVSSTTLIGVGVVATGVVASLPTTVTLTTTGAVALTAITGGSLIGGVLSNVAFEALANLLEGSDIEYEFRQKLERIRDED